jgi:hypothetical protein
MIYRLAEIFIFSVLLSTSAFAFNDGLLPQVPAGEPGKKVGDIISPTTRIQVAAWCDFSKQIVSINNGTLFICSYNGNTVGQ